MVNIWTVYFVGGLFTNGAISVLILANANFTDCIFVLATPYRQ